VGRCGALTVGGARAWSDVPQRILETVVPRKNGARVLAVRGRHRGSEGDMLVRDDDGSRALVQLDSESDPQWLPQDDVCELTGDD
jgi:hypothetical protein